jgi:TRAP-type transport system periplasmic protein
MKQRVFPIIVAVAALAGAASNVRAEEPTLLKYGNPGTSTSSIYLDLIKPWSEQVTKASHGTLDVKVFTGPTLVTMRNTYDRVHNGVADLAFCIMGPVSSQFPKTLVATLPFESENAHEAGLALQRLYDKGIIADEWKDVRPVAFGVFANQTYHTVPPVKTLGDLQGLKMSVQGRIAAETVKVLGAVPITLPITEVYQALQRGTIKGTAIAWPATITFKLTEVEHNHLRASLGAEDVVMIMNNATYAKLSGPAKKAVDDRIGTMYTNWFNKVIDDTEHENIGIIGRDKDQHIYKLPPKELAVWKARIRPLIDKWVKSTPDGARVLAAFRKEVANIRAGT